MPDVFVVVHIEREDSRDLTTQDVATIEAQLEQWRSHIDQLRSVTARPFEWGRMEELSRARYTQLLSSYWGEDEDAFYIDGEGQVHLLGEIELTLPSGEVVWAGEAPPDDAREFGAGELLDELIARDIDTLIHALDALSLSSPLVASIARIDG